MTKEELEKEAGDYADEHAFRVPYDGSNKFYDDVDFKASKEGYLAGAEPREKRITELEKENAELKEKLGDVQMKKANTPSYRPFLETAELILEWDKKLGDISVLGRPVEPCSLQEPLIWVKHKVDDRRRLITGFGEDFVEIGNKSKPVTMQRLFEMYTFLDGTPCGKQKEE